MLLQDFAPPPGIPGVGAGSSNSLVHYSQHNSGSSGFLLDPSLPPDTLAVTLAAKRTALMERESALQVSYHHVQTPARGHTHIPVIPCYQAFFASHIPGRVLCVDAFYTVVPGSAGPIHCTAAMLTDFANRPLHLIHPAALGCVFGHVSCPAAQQQQRPQASAV